MYVDYFTSFLCYGIEKIHLVKFNIVISFASIIPYVKQRP
jgi:hypothetical protein